MKTAEWKREAAKKVLFWVIICRPTFASSMRLALNVSVLLPTRAAIDSKYVVTRYYDIELIGVENCLT